MAYDPKKEALEIATKITIASAESKGVPACVAGKEAGAYFKALYEAILEITKTVVEG